VPASQRAREIQDALKAIVLQTASTLRARNQQARLPTSVASSSVPAATSISESSVNLEQLTGECTRYLSLVHGLRDYLLHAQAALEIELEAATQREAQEAKIAAEAAAEALKRQQEAEADSQRKAAEEAQTKAEPDAVAGAVASEDAKSEAAGGHADKKEGDEDDSMVATPPLPPAERPDVAADTATTGKAGEAAKDAIVIDSDGDDDEDDVPLAFAPKPGAAIDLTDSPALANAPKPSTSATDAASTSTAPTQAGTDPAPTHASAPPATVPNTVAGIDLSALGINLSSLNNLADLSSLGIPALGGSTSGDTTALAPATDFSELEKMMGMGFPTSSAPDASTAAPDLSSLGNFNLGSTGFGEDTDMFGAGTGAIDLSNFDFSSLTAGTTDAAAADAGVDLSSFLTNFNPAQLDGSAAGNQEGAGS
jgi:sRNA-binding protein